MVISTAENLPELNLTDALERGCAVAVFYHCARPFSFLEGISLPQAGDSHVQTPHTLSADILHKSLYYNAITFIANIRHTHTIKCVSNTTVRPLMRAYMGKCRAVDPWLSAKSYVERLKASEAMRLELIFVICSPDGENTIQFD